MHHLSLLTVSILALVALGAGIVDSITGGGGLITVPALLIAGLPPAMVLGTNRLQSCVGELTATIRFMKGGELNLLRMRWGFLLTAIGATAGTVLVQLLHPEHLRVIIAFLMLVILVYTILSPYLGKKENHPRLSPHAFYCLMGFGIGFYNGFFGPGTGAFWVAAFLFFLGFNIKNAVIHGKPLNFTGNVLSLIWFAVGGHVAYIIGLIMGAGQLIGAAIGAHLVMTHGTKLVRPLFITVVFLMTTYLFWQSFVK